MQIDPLPEVVCVTVFMEGLRTGVSRTEVFRVHPSTFDETVTVALKAKFKFKQLALTGMGTTQALRARRVSTAKPSLWTSAMLRR